MAIRQYIGARYVTKIYENSLNPSSAEWESGVTYEPLTLVTYNNSSYLSKKEVPGSIGNPAANPSYWVVTGAYNGQIASLQSQIDTINNTTIPGIVNDIGDVNTAINNIVNTTIPGIESELYSGDLSDHKIFFLMDSYGGYQTTDNKYLWTKFAEYTGATVDAVAQGAAGAYNGGFATALDSYAGDKSVFDTVYIVGGANDQPYSRAQVVPAVVSLINKIRTDFVNVKKILLMPCGITFSNVDSSNNPIGVGTRIYWQYYYDACRQTGATYVDNSQYILRNTKLLRSDKVHPTAEGLDEITRQCVQGFLTGSVDVDYVGSPTLTNLDPSWSAPVTYIMHRHNNIVTIQTLGGSGRLIRNGNAGTYTQGRINMGTFNYSYIDAPDDNSGEWLFRAGGYFTTNGTDFHAVHGMVGIDKETLFAYVDTEPESAGPTNYTRFELFGCPNIYIEEY